VQIAIAILFSVYVFGAFAYAFSSGLLPLKYGATLAGACLAAAAIVSVLIIKVRRKWAYIVAALIALIAIASSALGIYTLANSSQMLNSISSNTSKKIVFSVVVKADSPIKTIETLSDKKVGGVNSTDTTYISQVSAKAKLHNVVDAPSYSTLVDNLYDSKQDAIIFNEAYRGMVSETREKFDTETRVIAKYEFDEQNKAAEVSGNSFNLYISGIDTFGNIATVSRSDVNIIATINRDTHKILLTTIPRDSYVAIPGGGANQKDKLTHAGIYGVDASIGALEQLLDIKISAYARINFTSLIKLVDEVGGVTVNNPVGFTVDNGQHFPAGNITLKGDDALTFSRERHNLAGGDNDRGKNQQLVLAAIIDKMSSPSVLSNYQGIMSVLGKSMQTNLTSADISKLVNGQIEYGGKFATESLALTGKGQTGGLRSYAMPNNQLYMYVLDPASVSNAHGKIIKAMGKG